MKVSGTIFNWSTLLESPTDPYDPITNRRFWEFDGPTVTGNGTQYPFNMGVAELCLWLRRVNEIKIDISYTTPSGVSIGSVVAGATSGFGSLSNSEATVYLGGVRYSGHGSGSTSVEFGTRTATVPSLVHVGSGTFSELTNWFPYFVFGAEDEISTLDGPDTPDVAPFTLDISVTDPISGQLYTNACQLYAAGTIFTGAHTATMVATGFWPYT